MMSSLTNEKQSTSYRQADRMQIHGVVPMSYIKIKHVESMARRKATEGT